MDYIKFILFISNLSFIHSLALSVNKISAFPHLLNKPFNAEIIPNLNGNTLTSDPSDTMVTRIIDQNLNEKQKHHFYFGSQDSVDSEFKGKYMDILSWEKNTTENKITLSMMFKLISHDMFIEIFVFSASDKIQRRNILKDLNLAKNLLHQRINLFYPTKLNLSINSLNNNNINNTNVILPGDRVVATCRAYDGFPIRKPIFTIPHQLNITETVYDEEILELKIYFFVLINEHLQDLTCKAGDTSESNYIYISHHPTSIFVEPKIDKLVEPNTTLRCFVKDGYPSPEITWQFVSGPRNASMFYKIISNGSQLYMKSNSPIKSSWIFKCSVKGYSNITERIVPFSIAIHPSQIYVDPEIKKWLQSNSTMSCFIKGEDLNPEIKWQLVKGPTNASLYFDILKNGSEIYMNTNNLPGTKWTFRCIVKTVLTTSKIMNKTISFVIAKNFMKKCNENCINTKLLDLEESIEKNEKLHKDINQIKLLINQSTLDFQRFNRNIANWKVDMENKLDLFNKTMKKLKNKSNGNVLKIENNNKLLHDMIDQIKLSTNHSSTNFQRFHENNENWKSNVMTYLNLLNNTMELLKNELNAKKASESLKPILLSLNKPTEQSSTFFSNNRDLISNFAVDGHYSQNLQRDNRCTHTKNDLGAFWMVDLEDYYKINRIEIYNREDCCKDRLVGAIIEVLSKNDRIIDECGRIFESKSKYVIKCSSIIGQKIRIKLNKSDYLTLCEVEVFGFL